MEENSTLMTIANSNSPKNKETQMKQTDLCNALEITYSLKEFIPPLEVEIKESNTKQDIDLDTVCGIGCFTSQWLQQWATAKMYLVLYSVIGILNESYTPYLIGVMSTLEKRFAFKSQLSGTVLVMDKITPLVLGVLVGYFGGRIHRPRMVAFGMVLSSCGCFMSALPYFLRGADTHLISVSARNGTEFSGCEEKSEDCDADDRSPTMEAILLLLLGSFLKGFGNVAYFTVGLAYMDDNVKKKNTPIYLGLISTIWMLGPLLGYIMSYSFLKYHEDPSTDPGFGPEEPLWIGRWWAGFVLQGVLLMVCSVFIALFPRRLPGRASTSIERKEGFHLTGLWAVLKRLCKNPLYILLIIYDIFWFYGGYGHNIMLPKYMENQFRLSASQASLMSGPPVYIALMVITPISGYLVYKFKPNAKFLTGSLTVLQIIRVFGFLFLMIPKCEILHMSSYGLDEQGLILEGPCNANCSCSTNVFEPVCAGDGKTTFFSPCHAGCTGKINGYFTDCSCLDSYGLEENSATEGFCTDHGCWNQALVYTIALPIIKLVSDLLNVAKTTMVLRCIVTEDKSVALGTFETIISFFALLPMFFGAMVDSACLVWEKTCGQTGNCWFYDITMFNYLMHGTSALFTGFSAITMLIMFRLSTRMGDLYEEDEYIKKINEIADIVVNAGET